MNAIYLDYSASAPLRERSLQVMQKVAQRSFANTSSIHQYGRVARSVLERAREQVARAINAEALDVVFTSGGTESCNLAILGLAPPAGLAQPAGLAHNVTQVITSAVEHPAVREPIASMAAKGLTVSVLDMPQGLPPSLDAINKARKGDKTLLAIQWINHETGIYFPIEEYAAFCQEQDITLFVDATQALGKVTIDVSRFKRACLALASHKVGGPAGIGALWVTRDLSRKLAPLLLGGAQERGLRGGSASAMLAAGFGEAAELAATEARDELPVLSKKLKDKQWWFENELKNRGGIINAEGAPRIATITNVSFVGKRASDLVIALDLEGVCVSSGAACSSGLSEPSPVLRALYPDEPARAAGALRFSYSHQTTQRELENALSALDRVLSRC